MGALLADRTGRLLAPGRLTIVFTVLFGISIMGMALPFGPWWPTGPLTVFSLVSPAFNVVTSVVIARLAPQDMLGRVDAAHGVAGFGLAPLGPVLGPVLGGALAGTLGGAATLAVIGGSLLLTGLAAASSRELRSFTGAVPTGT